MLCGCRRSEDGAPSDNEIPVCPSSSCRSRLRLAIFEPGLTALESPSRGRYDALVCMDVRRPGAERPGPAVIELTILARSASDCRPREDCDEDGDLDPGRHGDGGRFHRGAIQSAGTVAQAPPAVKAKAKSANYYPLKVGTKWHYQLDAGTARRSSLSARSPGTKRSTARSSPAWKSRPTGRSCRPPSISSDQPGGLPGRA